MGVVLGWAWQVWVCCELGGALGVWPSLGVVSLGVVLWAWLDLGVV